MMRVAVVDSQTKVVVNIIVVDPSDTAYEGTYLIAIVDETPCGIGWVHDPIIGDFTDPNPPPPEQDGDG